jgi:UDP-N-acetylglucosamine acyltransferase
MDLKKFMLVMATAREFVIFNRSRKKTGKTVIIRNCFMASSRIIHNCLIGDNVIMANCFVTAVHMLKLATVLLISVHVRIQQFMKLGKGTMTLVAMYIIPCALCAVCRAVLKT